MNRLFLNKSLICIGIGINNAFIRLWTPASEITQFKRKKSWWCFWSHGFQSFVMYSDKSSQAKEMSNTPLIPIGYLCMCSVVRLSPPVWWGHRHADQLTPLSRDWLSVKRSTVAANKVRSLASDGCLFTMFAVIGNYAVKNDSITKRSLLISALRSHVPFHPYTWQLSALASITLAAKLHRFFSLFASD